MSRLEWLLLDLLHVSEADLERFERKKAAIEAALYKVYRDGLDRDFKGFAQSLGIPANTLSFHLKTLSHADLVHARQEGRFIFYSTNYEQMNGLLGFLTENCCGGQSCMPAVAASRKRKTS